MSSPVRITVDTPGKRFYERQVTFLLNSDPDGLVDSNYQDDAVLVTFDRIVRGRDALKASFRAYIEAVGVEEVVSTDKFNETDDTIFFEATMRTKLGIAHVYDAMVLRDGKIAYHFTGVK